MLSVNWVQSSNTPKWQRPKRPKSLEKVFSPPNLAINALLSSTTQTGPKKVCPSRNHEITLERKLQK